MTLDFVDRRPVVCLCVCVTHLNRCKTSAQFVLLFMNSAGGHSISLGLCPTKLPVKWDIQCGQLDVPAPFFLGNGTGLSQEPDTTWILWTISFALLPQSGTSFCSMTFRFSTSWTTLEFEIPNTRTRLLFSGIQFPNRSLCRSCSKQVCVKDGV